MILERGKKMCDCGVNHAKWVYMPGYANGDSPYICDDCISSPEDVGCSCNWNYGLPQEGLPTDEPEGVEGKDWRWVEKEADDYEGAIAKEEGYWLNLDERGRPYPCAEYEYSEDGFDNYTWLGEKMYSVSIWWFWFKRNIGYKVKGWWGRHIAAKVPDDYEGF